MLAVSLAVIVVYSSSPASTPYVNRPLGLCILQIWIDELQVLGANTHSYSWIYYSTSRLIFHSITTCFVSAVSIFHISTVLIVVNLSAGLTNSDLDSDPCFIMMNPCVLQLVVLVSLQEASGSFTPLILPDETLSLSLTLF